MTEEKIMGNKKENITRNYYEIIQEIHDENLSIRDVIFTKIIKLINQKDKFMLGPEKSKTASFIADNYQEVYDILVRLVLNNNIEGLD